MQARLVALVVALGLTGVSYVPELSPFVTVRRDQLFHAGEPFRFVGVNCYRLIERPERADDIFATLRGHGVRVVRFWAFPNRNRDFAGLDRLVAAAKRHDVLLLPVLENHWPDCNGDRAVKSRDWYAAGWRESYAAHLRAIGARYRDEPQIFGWQLVNEPEIYPDTDENFAVLQRFATDAARELKHADPNHIISLGLLGLGQPSTTGPRFRRLHGGQDVVTAHDYGYIYEALPGRDWPSPLNSFYGDLRDARALRKPFVATEAGIPLSWVNGDRDRRAQQFRAKLEAFFAAGGAGYLLWNFEPWPDTDHGFDATDPVMQVLAEVSARL
jgi:mannan endo-1,4-beta-mannosidase